jgi:hypothetical protein
MFIPTVIEQRSALEVVCRDPFLDDRNEPPEPSPPVVARRLATHGSPVWHSQRALVEAALLRTHRRAGARRADA